MTRRRREGIKRGERKLASNHFPMCSPQSVSLRDVHRVTQRREEGGRRQRWPEGEERESKGERESQPVSSFVCAFLSLDPSEIFRELHREEKREEGDRGGPGDIRGNQKGDRQI